MRIKKVKKTKNEYIYAGDVWVRNFTKLNSQFTQETNLLHKEDFNTILHNERSNFTLNLPYLSDETFYFPNVVIVSDGYDFDKRVESLRQMPSNTICVIAVNKALKKWRWVGIENPRPINFYLINNPYDEAQFYLPTKYFPTCIASSRTSHEFLSNYPGIRYLYEPTPEKGYGYEKTQKYFIDDYRNPIAAAMSIAYRFGAQKIMLMCCDDSFEQEKPGAVQLENGLWTYQQHIRSQEILDTNAYWLQQAGVKVANYSSGLEYSNAAYIQSDEEVENFFVNKDKP